MFCGVAEWFYIRLGMSEEVRQAVVQFFKDTSATMIACYVGFLVFGVTLFIAIVSGSTNIPSWACIFNVVPMLLLFMPLRIGGTGNWCSAVMFFALFLLV